MINETSYKAHFLQEFAGFKPCYRDPESLYQCQYISCIDEQLERLKLFCQLPTQLQVSDSHTEKCWLNDVYNFSKLALHCDFCLKDDPIDTWDVNNPQLVLSRRLGKSILDNSLNYDDYCSFTKLKFKGDSSRKAWP